MTDGEKERERNSERERGKKQIKVKKEWKKLLLKLKRFVKNFGKK